MRVDGFVRSGRVVNRVRATRQQRGLTMLALARAAGISRQTLDWIERKPGHNPTAATMVRLAGALGVDWAELFWAETARTEPAA